MIQPYSGFKVGLWADPDVGCFTDDFIGCQPESNTFYFYNADNWDDPVACPYGVHGYGDNPPAQTVTFLNQTLESFLYYYGGHTDVSPEQGGPVADIEFYRFMSGKWRTGKVMTWGGDGYDTRSTDTTLFAFPDSPTDSLGWSMASAELWPDDRRVIGVHGLESTSGVLDAGASTRLDVAFSYHRDTTLDNLQVVDFALSRISGIQSLYETGFSGCTYSSCDCNCVVPGDANNNGIVNYRDVVNIFQAWNMTGSEREGSLSRTGKYVSDWSHNIPGGVNAKYADVDGSGIIDENDIDVIQDFLGHINSCYIEKQQECPEGNALTWLSHAKDSIFNLGTFYRPDLILTEENDIWGLSYEIIYDSDLIQVDETLNYLSWQDDSVQTHFYKNVLENNHTTHIQLVKLNDQNQNKPLSANENNRILKLLLRGKKIPSEYHKPHVEIKVCDAIAYFEDGTRKSLPTQVLKFRLPDSVTITNTTVLNDMKSWQVFPNPNTGQFIVRGDGDNISHLLIFDLQGRPVYRDQLDEEDNVIELEHLASGTYFVKVSSGSDVQTFKILIQK